MIAWVTSRPIVFKATTPVIIFPTLFSWKSNVKRTKGDPVTIRSVCGFSCCVRVHRLTIHLVHSQAYDQHLNLILGEVEETVTTTEIDEETDEEIVRKATRKVGMLFVRGDIVVLVSPPLRTT